jgi:hypothetical protein
VVQTIQEVQVVYLVKVVQEARVVYFAKVDLVVHLVLGDQVDYSRVHSVDLMFYLAKVDLEG